MARLIVKSPYIKCGAGQNAGGYLKYLSLIHILCRGYAQANLIILPPEYAGDFEEFAKRNPFPCPILEIIRGLSLIHI